MPQKKSGGEFLGLTASYLSGAGVFLTQAGKTYEVVCDGVLVFGHGRDCEEWECGFEGRIRITRHRKCMGGLMCPYCGERLRIRRVIGNDGR